MPPQLALLVWFVLLVALFAFDPAKTRNASTALWIPVIWMFIISTRLPSQWIGQVGQSAQALEEGNPLDRTIYSLLILLAVGVLVSRAVKWETLFSRNLALAVFLLFALISVTWSDFPFVAFKRWFRDLGNYAVILVPLTEPVPMEGLRIVLRRLSYLLVPLSVVLIKYFPEVSRSYDPWTGVAQIVGPTTGKNQLGVIALLCGLFFFWDVVTRWPARKDRRLRRVILLNIAFIGMALWILNLARSTTAYVCLLLGGMVIVAAQARFFLRRSRILGYGIPACFCLYVVLAFGFGMNGAFAGAVGKDPTLTDRTKIWAFVLSMHTNPVWGTGYESFWMGDRITRFWSNAGLGRINEAHNGFLEVYLQLGGVGVALLSLFLITSYRNAKRKLTVDSSAAAFGLSMWLVLLFFSMTEAGFRSNLIWLTFLMATVIPPKRVKYRVQRPVDETQRSLRPGHEVPIVLHDTASVQRF